jgi:hypothetical protein
LSISLVLTHWLSTKVIQTCKLCWI